MSSLQKSRVTVHVFQRDKFPENKFDSGLISMMFANALLAGKSFSFKQVILYDWLQSALLLIISYLLGLVFVDVHM